MVLLGCAAMLFARAQGQAVANPVASGNWSSPATWGGSLPGPEQDVTIPTGITVTLDTTMEVGSILVNGVLRAAAQDLALTCDSLVVTGPTALFEVGTEAARFQHAFTLTLKGLASEEDPMMGAKVLGAMNGGTIHVHGPDRVDWTRLSATAAKNATSITLADPVDWLPGEEIVIASTDFDAHQAEKRTIATVSPDGRTVTFATPLQWMHFGTVQTYSNSNRSFTLDERAEVGLLSRRVKIQGDAASETSGFGGHIMVMLCNCGPTPAKGWIEGAELFRMGQKGLIGRYPWHWHHVGDATGQYIRGCGIHRSFNRAVTVHNTNNALVEDNVAYDHIGHGFFLEDGGEVGNTFRRNLGLLTRMPAAGEEVRAHDRVFDGEDPAEGGESSGAFTLVKLPATFWITNPANHFINNVAAGSDGSGFWMVALAAPVGSYNGPAMIPGRMAMGTFSGNRAHSNSFSNLAIDGGIDPVTHDLSGGHYRSRQTPSNFSSPIVIPEITGFTGYKCRDRCLWFRADSMNIRESVLADNSRATFFAYNQVMHDSLIVGQSANTGNPVSAAEIAAGRSLPNPASNSSFRGHSIYDGPSGIIRVHFAGFTGKDRALQTNGASQKSPVHFAEGITWDPAIPEANKVDFAPAAFRDYMYASGLIDRDGSITGIPGGRITPDMPTSYNGRVMEDFNVTPAAVRRPEWDAWVCPPTEKYGLMRLDNKWAQYSATPIFALRSDGPAAYNIQTYEWYSQNPVIVNSALRYAFQYTKVANRIDANLRFLDNGDTAVVSFPNLKSATRVYRNGTTTALGQASSLVDLLGGSTERYWFRDNTLHVKLVGAGGGYDPQFGNDRSAKSSNVVICQNANGADATGRTDRATLADFEMGADSRGSLQGELALVSAALSADSPGPASGPFDGTDHQVSWSLVSDGDGVDEAVDYRLDFPGQIWSEFPALALNFSGPRMEVLVVDSGDGIRSLGVFDPADSAKIRLAGGTPARFLDQVTGLICRVRESRWSGLSATSSATVGLRGIELLADATAPFSTSFSDDLDNDGVPNSAEPAGDVDLDGIPNAEDIDSDGDAMEDGEEVIAGRDPWSPRDFAFHFNGDGNFEGWDNRANISGHAVSGGKVSGTTVTSDPYFWRVGLNMPGSVISHVVVKMKTVTTGSVQLYWGRTGAGGFAGSRFAQVTYSPANQWQAVRFAVGSHAEWNGRIITDLRIDPIGSANRFFEVDWIRGSDGDLDDDGLTDSAEGSADGDADGLLNLEDTDSDNDGRPDLIDAQPYVFNPPDHDNDGIPDATDPDDDNDGVPDVTDAFPFNAAESLDSDNDTVGNNADPDDDNDGVTDASDAFPLDAAESIDTDGDLLGNNADPDDDNDGVTDAADAFPLNPAESLDSDGDLIGNNADPDDDNDGVADAADAFPFNPAESLDTDGDLLGNNADPDDDNDGVADAADAFPLDPAESLDSDGDLLGNNADPDDDNDGALDAADAYPLDPAESLNTDGDLLGNNADLDDDGDAMSDIAELGAGRDPLDARDFAFHFNTDGDFEGWSNRASITGHAVSGGRMSGTTVTSDPHFWRTGLSMPGSQIAAVLVKMKTGASGNLQLYWGRSGAPNFGEARVVQAPYGPANQWQAVRVPLAAHAEWNGRFITSLRIDPITSANQFFEIDWIRGSDGDFDDDGISDALEGGGDVDGDGLLNLEDLDSDNDTLPDALEFSLGLASNVAIDPAADSDGDGQTDLLEITAGTGHADRADRFVWSVAVGPAPQVHLQVKPGRSYAVEACDDLTAGNWQVIGGTVPAEAGTYQVTDPVSGAPRRFYRVRIQLVP